MLSMQMTAPTIFVTVLTQGVIECDAQNYFQQQRILFIYFIFFYFCQNVAHACFPIACKEIQSRFCSTGYGLFVVHC